jgi:hypothetical protein
MYKCLFVYRFHEKFVGVKSKILKHFLERVRNFAIAINDVPEFVLIADETSQDVINEIRTSVKTIVGNMIDFDLVEVKQLPPQDSDRPHPNEFPGRVLPNGEVTYAHKNKLFTHCVSSMTEAVNRAKDDNTVVFFCEDDYLYREDALLKGYKMQCKFDNDFVSFYDCPTLYKHSMKDPTYPHPVRDLRHEFGHHWWAGHSACLTYIATMKSLKAHGNWFLNQEKYECWGSNRLWGGMWKMGKSRLWVSLPSLVYHCRSINFPNPYWESLKKSL